MQAVSSNYLDASGYETNQMGPKNPSLKEGESYYLSADNSEDLSRAFVSIAQGIGGASVELNETTVMQDVLSEYFELPENATEKDITWEVKEQASDGSWKKVQQPADPVRVEIVDQDNGKKTIHVTGFDYSEHYVADDHAGQKLVVHIPIQYLPEASFGGNDIPTNGSTSGIYNDDGSLCYGNFEIPTVNHPIDYEIDSEDKAIYIGNNTTWKDLLSYTQGYVPDGVKNKFVTITYQIYDEKQNLLGTLEIPSGTPAEVPEWKPVQSEQIELTECSDYKITCKVTPTSEGENAFNKDEKATGKDLSPETPRIHVYIPHIKTEDQVVFLGDSLNFGESETLEKQIVESVEWKDQSGHLVSDIKMEGSAPVLKYQAQFVENADNSSEPASLQQYAPISDSNFKLAVQVNKKQLESGQYRLTNDEKSDESCYKPFVGQQQDHDFTIHVVAGEINIKKMLENAKNRRPELEGDPIFTFRISDKGGHTWYRFVRIGGDEESASAEILYGLPKGEYTIEELDTIRYENTDVSIESNSCPVDKQTNSMVAYIGYSNKENPTTDVTHRKAVVTFTNTRNDSSKLTDSDIRLNRFTKTKDGNWTCEEITTPQSQETNN